VDFKQPTVDVGDDVSDSHRPKIVGHAPSTQIASLAADRRIGTVAVRGTQTGAVKQARGRWSSSQQK